MRQKREINDRYQDFTKKWLISVGVDLIIDGVSTRDISTTALKMFYDNYQTLEVRQYSKKFKRWITKKPVKNTKTHDKGILKECSYYQISISVPHKPSKGVPLHRIVYVWFNDVIKPYNDDKEKLEVCHYRRYEDPVKDSHLLNLFIGTAKLNRAMRQGARNQHDTVRAKQYGLQALKDENGKWLICGKN